MKLQQTTTETALQGAVKACQFIASCPYKGTAIKFECEGQLNRPDNGGICPNCDGEPCQPCETCDNGTIFCDACDDNTEHDNSNCSDGYRNCPENCDDGYNYCENCDDGRINDGTWDLHASLNFILDNVAEQLGVYSYSNEIIDGTDDHQYSEIDKPLKDVIYARFYNDGSVDSELTVTIDIEHPELIPMFKRAFKALSVEIGNGLNVSGAGFHIAILNSADGSYPYGNHLHAERFNNFRNAMQHFIPALYFLGTSDYKSRGLRYRQPEIARYDKYGLISGASDVLEYRFFETAYDRPDTVYDYLCVIANTLKYYTLKPKNLEFFGTIGALPIKDGRGLHRFYYSDKHIKALEYGVRSLKPSYKSFEQLKRERNFKIDSASLAKRHKKLEAKYTIQYSEFSDRQKLDREIAILRWRKEYREMTSPDISETAFIARNLKHNFAEISKDMFVSQQLDNLNNNDINTVIRV